MDSILDIHLVNHFLHKRHPTILMSSLEKKFLIKSKDFIRAGEASIAVQSLLKSMQFDPDLIRRIAICGYEGEMNAVMHGGDATMTVEIDSEKLTLIITDTGEGIDSIEQAMQPGFSTASDEVREMGFGAGMGLPNMKKNSDDIQIESETGKGTRVQMIFHLHKEDQVP